VRRITREVEMAPEGGSTDLFNSKRMETKFLSLRSEKRAFSHRFAFISHAKRYNKLKRNDLKRKNAAMQYRNAAGTRKWTMYRDMQLGHRHAEWTSSMDTHMRNREGHTAWTCT
jgi:hypothetical protein